MIASLITAPLRVGAGPGIGSLSGWLLAGLAVLALAAVARWVARGRRQ